MEYLIGVVLAAATCVFFGMLVGFDRERLFYPMMLPPIATYYILFAAMGSSTPALTIESLVASIFLVAAVVGFKKNLWLIVAALVGHGVFDFFHHLVVLVWRLDRWGRSLADLVLTLKELAELGVGFVSLTEALDLTTPIGRAMAGLLAVLAEFEHDVLQERVRAGLAEARRNGKPLGRPRTAALHAGQVRKLYRSGVSKAEIARRLNIGRTSVRRILG